MRWLLILCLSLVWMPVSAQQWAPVPHVQVEGQATLLLEADRVDLRATFTAEHRESRLALQDLERRVQEVQRRLRRQLPEGVRLEASQISIQPRHTRRQDQWVISGYVATREIRLLNLDVTEAGPWIEALVAAEPHQLGPFEYRSSLMSAQQHPALQAAIEDARAKAELMASSLGARLGAPLQLEEITSPQPAALMRAEVMMAADTLSNAPELDAGQLEAQARVRLVFELLP
ncbi:SIMPL domain-containing protein [Marinospirillum sp.]|uniref:SIMPL domain-containing protein n=1 Tax=Marinospirillum sp. TaxID=2183934 RepID=UPI003A84BAA9